MKTGKIDLKRAFIPVTADLREGIEEAFERGEREMKKRHRIVSLLSVAAVLLVVFGVAALAANEIYAPREDNVVLSAGEAMRVPDATLAPEAEEREKPDFTHVDPAQEDALCKLLDMAYRDYCAINGLEADDRAAQVAELILMVPWNYGMESSGWIEPVQLYMRVALGLSQEYIEENCLTNYVIACLVMQQYNEWVLGRQNAEAAAEEPEDGVVYDQEENIVDYILIE